MRESVWGRISREVGDLVALRKAKKMVDDTSEYSADEFVEFLLNVSEQVENGYPRTYATKVLTKYWRNKLIEELDENRKFNSW